MKKSSSYRFLKTQYLLSVLLIVWSAVSSAQAVKQSSAADQALKKAQGMLRQITEEKSALATENKALQEQMTQLQAAVSQLQPLQAEVERYKTGLQTWQDAHQSAQAQLGQAREAEQQLKAQMQTLIGQARAIQQDNQLLVNAVKERETWIKQCTDKNQQLIATNHEMLDQFKTKGFWEQVVANEPFTGIGHVEEEVKAETYQFKLEDLAVTDFQETEQPQTNSNSDQTSNNQNLEKTEQFNPTEEK